MKIAAIIIVYNPDLGEVTKNLRSILPFVDEVIIWKNSPHSIPLPEDYQHKILVMGNGMNKFIAEPLNKAIRYCNEQGYDYLLTMDQDSTWIDLGGFLKKVRGLNSENVVIYSPNINNAIESEYSQCEVQSVITSGALHNVQIVDKLGGFREDYEIYWVDGEFCYWARYNGFKVIVLTEFELIHRLGNVKRKVLGIAASNYSPTVYYYLVRNMLWMRREFAKGVSVKTILHTLKFHVTAIILSENRKFTKLYKIIRAFNDGLFGRFEKRKSI